MNTVLRWYGGEVQKRITEETTRRLHACCIVVASHAKKLISIQGTVAVSATGAMKRDKKGRFKRVYGSNPSRPWEPPHKQTGRLRGSVAWEVVGLVGRVGTNLLYGRWLELGTKRMKPRPWLRRALRECQDKIRAIFAKPMSGGNRK